MKLLSIPQGPSSFAPPARSLPTAWAVHSPQVGFLHGEAVFIDAGGGHAAAEHILCRGDISLLGDTLQVGQIAVEQGAVRPGLAASLCFSDPSHLGPSEDPAGGQEPLGRGQDLWCLQVAHGHRPEVAGPSRRSSFPFSIVSPRTVLLRRSITLGGCHQEWHCPKNSGGRETSSQPPSPHMPSVMPRTASLNDEAMLLRKWCRPSAAPPRSNVTLDVTRDHPPATFPVGGLAPGGPSALV